jgi:L-ascorbate metabolism protein UlaG (beta-lactamase superfamily)
VPDFRDHSFPLRSYTVAPPDSFIRVGDLTVYTIKSPIDSGCGFLVEVDGLRIYHPGDAVNSTRDLPDPFMDRVGTLGAGGPVDIAFLPVAGCGMNDLTALRTGQNCQLERLSPRLVIPMHSGDLEDEYRDFVAALPLNLHSTGWWKRHTWAFSHPGDRIVYQANGKTVREAK